MTVDIKINLDSTQRILDWPGPFKGCSECKRTYETSGFLNHLLQINRSDLKRQGVPDSVVSLSMNIITYSKFTQSSLCVSKQQYIIVHLKFFLGNIFCSNYKYYSSLAFDFDKILFQSTEIKDLATCARSAAMCRFGDAAMKEYLHSIIQHTRRFYICNKHSEYVGM